MKKIAIVYDDLDNAVRKRALEELTKIILEYTLEYPVCIPSAEYGADSDYYPIYLGTKSSNAHIASTSSVSLGKPEEYYLGVFADHAVIEGFDDAGALYGALDFYARYIVKKEHPENDTYWQNPFLAEGLPCYEFSSAPSVRERGLWTWGHVIYDYRGYIDNMMRLKMNSVIIWNDFAPANARDIVEYAHARNIKVIFGFAWLWDRRCDLVDVKNLDGFSEKIFEKYEREYAHLGADGIYFQTFTELKEDNIGGVLVAQAAADFVNKTAALFYKKYPEIELQFGLHATSVKEKLGFIATVDPRIRIVWEDCGAFPFSYVPTDLEGYEEAMELAVKTALLRGDNDKYGAVTKGLVKLDWPSFEHMTASHCVGVSSELMKRNRIERKSRIWRYIQAGWIANADKAHEMIRALSLAKGGDLSLYALVEDGMFEENILYPVALYAEMLWDCSSDTKELTSRVALRSYVSFA